MVSADAHGRAVLLADFQQRRKALPDAVNFFKVIGISIFNELKFLFIYIVARVHANFLYNPWCNFSGIGREVNVWNKRRIITPAPKLIFYIKQVLCFFF